MLNEPLIRNVVKHIEEYPEEWDQTSYGIEVRWQEEPPNKKIWARCSTTACFAGWALVLSKTEVNACGDLIPLERFDARDVLGFTEEQTDKIFYWYPPNDLSATEKVAALKARLTEVTGLVF